MFEKHAVTAIVLAVAAAGPLAAQAGPSVIAVTTNEYAFADAPDTVPAGLVTFAMKNAGREPHHVWVARLDDGKTVADLAAALSTQGPPPPWFVSVGGPQPMAPGVVSSATLSLAPGNYVYLCFVPGPDGAPHVAKGMMRPFTVAGEVAPAAASLPEADVTVRLVDYGFELSEPLTAGRRTVRFVNPSAQFHEVLLMKLEPGSTAAEAVAWMETMDGPPPMTLAGGVTGIDPGVEAQVTLDLAPGEYGLVCFLPDRGDGKPHVMHGMITQITVR